MVYVGGGGALGRENKTYIMTFAGNGASCAVVDRGNFPSCVAGSGGCISAGNYHNTL